VVRIVAVLFVIGVCVPTSSLRAQGRLPGDVRNSQALRLELLTTGDTVWVGSLEDRTKASRVTFGYFLRHSSSGAGGNATLVDLRMDHDEGTTLVTGCWVGDEVRADSIAPSDTLVALVPKHDVADFLPAKKAWRLSRHPLRIVTIRPERVHCNNPFAH